MRTVEAERGASIVHSWHAGKMKKRVTDLDINQLRLEAGRAWSVAANRALQAGLELGGEAQPDAESTKLADKASPKSGKTRVKAA